MSTKNADLVLELLIEAVSHANELSDLLQNARAVGRDITDSELDGLSEKAKASLDRLRADKAGG